MKIYSRAFILIITVYESGNVTVELYGDCIFVVEFRADVEFDDGVLD